MSRIKELKAKAERLTRADLRDLFLGILDEMETTDVPAPAPKPKAKKAAPKSKVVKPDNDTAAAMVNES